METATVNGKDYQPKPEDYENSCLGCVAIQSKELCFKLAKYNCDDRIWEEVKP